MRHTQQSLAIAVVILCLGLGTVLQAGAHEGATRSDGLGDVHFSVSYTDAAQAKFHRAMALYHSFDWPRGKAAFDEIASLDPRCGMAYWGLAMVAADNPFGWPISLKLKEGKISRFWDAGKHTTNFSQMYRIHAGDLAGDAFVIDTPGIRVFRLHGVTIRNLPDLFPEFAPFEGRCQFSGCLHDHEPDCAVFEAVESGELAPSRYASYVEMLDEMRGKAPQVEPEPGE